VTDRRIRFTEQFFDRLDALLPTERGADGAPSVTDFLLLDLPRVRDRLVHDFEGNTKRIAEELRGRSSARAAGLVLVRFADRFRHRVCNLLSVFHCVFGPLDD
jgi:hypothetical protein